jgi:hypothetical protein
MLRSLLIGSVLACLTCVSLANALETTNSGVQDNGNMVSNVNIGGDIASDLSLVAITEKWINDEDIVYFYVFWSRDLEKLHKTEVSYKPDSAIDYTYSGVYNFDHEWREIAREFSEPKHIVRNLEIIGNFNITAPYTGTMTTQDMGQQNTEKSTPSNNRRLDDILSGRDVVKLQNYSTNYNSQIHTHIAENPNADFDYVDSRVTSYNHKSQPLDMTERPINGIDSPESNPDSNSILFTIMHAIAGVMHFFLQIILDIRNFIQSL